MAETKTLTRYEEDLLAWSREQAEALRAASRAGSNLAIDWENLAGEIEDLGASQRHALHSQIQRIIRHLLKLQYSSAVEPRRRWDDSIEDARSEIELLLVGSPSLAREIPEAVRAEFLRGSRRAIRDLEKYGELDETAADRIRATTYTPEQVVGDWFPPRRRG